MLKMCGNGENLIATWIKNFQWNCKDLKKLLLQRTI